MHAIRCLEDNEHNDYSHGIKISKEDLWYDQKVPIYVVGYGDANVFGYHRYS